MLEAYIESSQILATAKQPRWRALNGNKDKVLCIFVVGTDGFNSTKKASYVPRTLPFFGLLS